MAAAAFTVLHERAAPVGGGDDGRCLTACCPAMDLVAFAGGGQLAVARSIKWEPLFRASCDASCMVWRPDGKALAVGQEDGLIALYDVETGEEFSLLRAARPHSNPIVCMCWCKEADDLERNPAGARDAAAAAAERPRTAYRDRSALLPKVRPMPGAEHERDSSGAGAALRSQASALTDMPLFGVESTPRKKLEVLVSGDTSGVVTLSAFGYFSIGCIDLGGAFAEDNLDGPPRVCHVRLSDDLRMMVSILEACGKYRLVVVDTSVLSRRSEELRHVAAQCGHISEQIANVQNAVKAMAKKWEEATAALERHVEPLAHQLRCFDRPNSPEQELFMMLTCGVTSAALQRYIADLQEQSLQRLGKTLDQTCAEVEHIAATTLTPASQALVFRLHDMLGLAEWTAKFELDAKVVRALLHDAQQLLLKAQETLVWVREARTNFAAFTVWLQAVWRKNQKPHLDASDRKHVAHVDIDRLVTLLSGELLHGHITQQFGAQRLEPRGEPVLWTTAAQSVRHDASLRQSLDQLVDTWTKAFHMTSETVSESFRPLENHRLPELHARLVDVDFAEGEFRIVVGGAGGNEPTGESSLRILRRSCDPNCPRGVRESVLRLAGVDAISDVSFYNADKVLLAFTDGDKRRYVGELPFAEAEASVGRRRELQPASWQTAQLACQGKRGIALVFASTGRLTLLDMEEDEDDDSEDEDEDEDQDEDQDTGGAALE